MKTFQLAPSHDAGSLLATHQPLQALVGYPPDTLMTTRADGRDYDSFMPASVGELARWTIVETSRDGLLRRRWQAP